MLWLRRTIALAVGLGLCLVAGATAVVGIGPRALVAAPNRGLPAERAVTPGPHRCDRAVNSFAVGPPGATLSVSRLGPADSDDANPPRGTMFVLHGIGDHKESLLGWGRRLAEARYRVLLVDSRGHGHSSGDWLTFGVQESRDLSRLLDQLETCALVAGPVGVMGVSYGAATAIQWAAHEPRIEAVVSVASFSSLRVVVPLYFQRMLPIASRVVPSFLVDATVARAGRMAGFDPDEASPIAAMARVRVPVLLIHGRADIHIPPSHSEALRAAAPDHATLVLLDGEDHLSISDDRSGRLWRETLAFLAAHLQGQNED